MINRRIPVKTKRIPKKSYNYNYIHVDNVLDEINSEYLGHMDVISTGLTHSNELIAGESKHKIVVTIKEGEPGPEIEKEYKGVKVKKKFEKPPREATHLGGCQGEQEFDPVPGGAKIVVDPGDDDRVGTIAAKYSDIGDDSDVDYLLTASHVTDERGNWGCDVGIGQNIYQNNNFIGEVVKGKREAIGH